MYLQTFFTDKHGYTTYCYLIMGRSTPARIDKVANYLRRHSDDFTVIGFDDMMYYAITF